MITDTFWIINSDQSDNQLIVEMLKRWKMNVSNVYIYTRSKMNNQSKLNEKYISDCVRNKMYHEMKITIN